ncbi:MAG: endonuclease III [Mollicutes bacterium]|nr:endonuclease III [Mollicutes bacterium]
MMNRIIAYLEELIPNPVIELNYSKDYELLLAVMLSAQATDKMVNAATSILFTKYPSLEALRDADIEDIMDIIRPVGTFKRKALYLKKIVTELLDKYEGVVPNDRNRLEKLPGIGRKSANVVLSVLYNEPYIAVDTHVSRVSVRLGLANSNDDVLTIEKKLTKIIPKEKTKDMHLRLVLFGRYYCLARNPKCQNCKLYDICKTKEKERFK